MTDVLEQKGYFVDPVFGLENLKFEYTYSILTGTHTLAARENPYNYSIELEKRLKEKPELKNILAKNGFVKDDGQVNWPSHIVNNFGFRSDDWETGEKGIIFLGCSDMFGYSQYLQYTMSYIVSEHFNLKNYNLSVPGGGLDQCYRILKYHVENINSDTVVLLVPEASRRVFYTKFTEGLLTASAIENNVTKEMADGELDTSFLTEVFIKLFCNEYDMFLHANKNIDAIKYICQKHNKRLIIMKNPLYYLEKDSFELHRELREVGGRGEEGVWRPDDVAADLCHYGAKSQKIIANRIISKF